MVGLIHTIFDNLEVHKLNQEETLECLYYIDYVIENEESPESFFKYQLYKLKLLEHLKEIAKTDLSGTWLSKVKPATDNFNFIK